MHKLNNVLTILYKGLALGLGHDRYVVGSGGIMGCLKDNS